MRNSCDSTASAALLQVTPELSDMLLSRTVLRQPRYCRQVRAMASRPTFLDGPGSDELRARSCAGKCGPDVPKLSVEELERHMPALPAWKLSDDKTNITRSFIAKNFVAAIEFFNKVKDVAESEGHHPDLHLTDFRKVMVHISTHSVGGLTLLDLILASKIDEVDVTYSPKWLREQEGAE
eukprot:TRINITY_DN4947_c0_g3_i1.p2 TRINITY_DN4947_c0_g3~~TRINITY_DN4947_c0_g3_i1.p2  ORF type:complete len:180 (+),score=15.73 TRINITY_DN4947_c0_g3_i1:95-634(+)